MKDKLLTIIEGMFYITSIASFILVCYVMMAISNMPQ